MPDQTIRSGEDCLKSQVFSSDVDRKSSVISADALSHQ